MSGSRDPRRLRLGPLRTYIAVARAFLGTNGSMTGSDSPYTGQSGPRKHQSGTGFMTVTVTINGETRHLGGPVSVSVLLTGMGLDPGKIAVERNQEVVPRSQYNDTTVADGDKLEIVQFIGGGNEPDRPVDKPLVIAGRTYKSRLIIGTGK